MARSDVLRCTTVGERWGEGSRKVVLAMGAIGSIKRLHQLSEREPKPAGCPVPSLLPLRSMLAFLPFPFLF